MRNAIVFQEMEAEDAVRIIKSQTIPEAINLFSHNNMAEDRDVNDSRGIKRLAKISFQNSSAAPFINYASKCSAKDD
jgi:hypothetical protein